ncbi:hypothetical protein CAEBREN_09879 [Caenorhabditis brenneri]|uniref:Nose resistant-to-fluoxetine protein N-terminal domain-containing protein n=1 Tax=Caenorhabditis brenneri TaxID=135651 RepID=G0NMU9_CAEBE|nr:hypothetical protein CAEBREN_09879 [Caenorhabditis brenneri]
MKSSFFLLFLTFPFVESQFFLPSGFTSFLSNNLNIPPSVFYKLSPKCVQETGMFLNSLIQSAKVLESCNNKSCLNKLEEHSFALKQFDAFGKIPPGISQWRTISDGSYQACQDVDGMKYPTNYCYLLLVPGKNSTCPDISNLSQEMTDPQNIILKLAVCIPLSCSSDDVATIFDSISSLPLTACETQCVKKEQNLSFWFCAFVLFLTLMTIISLLGTILDYYWVNTDDKDVKFRILCCFSLYSNFKTILSTKTEEGHLKSVNFLNSNTGVSQHICSRTFWVKLLIRRYLRLVPPLMIFIGVFMFSAQFFEGPVMISLFDNMNKQAEKCSDVWWVNLFMMQNFRRPSDNCYPISWYVSADFQCFLLAPLIVIPIMKSQREGLKTTSMLTITSFLATLFAFSYYTLPPFNYALKGMEEYLTFVHQSSFQRISTFIVGIYLGKLLATSQFPSDFLRNHSRKLWILSGIATFLCFYGKLLAVADMGEMEMNPILSAAHHIFHRTLWVFVVSWIIYSCHFDLNLFFSTIVNHSVWQPLGRLNYSVYIIHWWMLYVVMNQSDRSLHFVSHVQVIFTVTIPTVILCVPAALVWSSMFEVPIGRLEKLFLSGYRNV